MGQKVNPIGFRLAVNPDLWESRWFARSKSEYSKNVLEDHHIRNFLKEKLRFASVSRILIERSGARIRVTISSARPGIIIGRKGKDLDKLKEDLQKFTNSEIILDIQDVKYPDLDANIVAQSIALQIQRRISYRRAMKKALETTMSLGAKGIRIEVSGRLGGADIARSEKQRKGSVSLQTFREEIDYGFEESRTLYGIIGVKVWICKKSEESK